MTETKTDQDQQLHEQVQKQIDMFRPIFNSEGGDIQLTTVKDGVATVIFFSGCAGCGTSPLAAMEGGFKRTLLEKVSGLRNVIINQG